MIRILVGALALTLAQAAAAHYLWLEREEGGARLYFGEVNEVREQSPGRLDEIAAPRIWSAGAAPRELRAVRGAGAFRIEGAATEHLVAVEAGYPVQDWTRYGHGVVKPMFYARSSPWPAREVPASDALRLDVRPLPGAGDRVQVLFDGKPLAKAKVVVHAPNGWDQEQQADAAGAATVSLPWRGQYVFEVVHREPHAGAAGSPAFEAWRHRATLTIVRRDGIDPQGTGTLAPRLPER